MPDHIVAGMPALRLAAVAAAALAVPALAEPPAADSPVTQTSAGPCNLVTVNINAHDLSHGIIEGLAVQHAGRLGSVDVRRVNVYLAVTIRAGNLSCTTTNSASRVGGVTGPTGTTITDPRYTYRSSSARPAR